MPKASLENHGEMAKCITNSNNNKKKYSHQLSKILCVRLYVYLYNSSGYKKPEKRKPKPFG